MQEVRIYVMTTAKGPAIRKYAHYIYILECDTPNGPVKRKGSGTIENCTENQIELTALIKAFMRLNKSCSVRVFTRCEHILNSVGNGWVYQWKKNGWRKSGDRPVKNAELWQQLLNVTEKHSVTYSSEDHSYVRWQEWELNRMKEAYNGKKI